MLGEAVVTMPLYPTEDQIARAVLGERHKDWPGVAALDERKGLPKIDPVHGGRYWPAVCRFYDIINEIGPNAADAPRPLSRIRTVPLAPDGQEDPDGEKQAALHCRRRDRRPVRARALHHP